MTIQEVIDRIIAYHPDLGEQLATTCDVLKWGDPTQECTGVATAIYASPKVIEKAHAAGCNLLLVHEPAFYSHMDDHDWLVGNTVADAKKKLLDEYRMVIFRDHDRIRVIHEKGARDHRAELLSLDHDRIDNVIHTGVTAEHIGFSEVLCHLSCADMLLGTVPSRFIMTGKLCTVGVFFPVLQELSAVFIDQRNIEPGDCMKSLQHIPQFLL